MAADKEIPFCTIFLVVGAIVCNTLVLVGNLETSASFKDMGSSTGGWSNVGQAMASSFDNELDTLMTDITLKLTGAVEDIAKVTTELDKMLSLIGNKTDKSLLEVAHKSAHIAVKGKNGTSMTIADIKSAAMADVSDLIKSEVSTINELLQAMLKKASPALLQIGKWETSFGTKLQQDISQFGTTIDWVQKTFDQIMQKLHGENMKYEPYMLYNTFNLFDPDANDCITYEGLQGIATQYGITAVSGSKGEEIFEEYSKDGCINKEQYAQMVLNPGLQGILGTILRTYAEDLAEVGGSLNQARLRDDVADAVVDYLNLVSAKNHTKVGWIAERLTNGSIPMAFTACVMRELVEQMSDPNVLTTVNVGALVMEYMVYLNQTYTLESLKLLTSPKFWISQGFLPDNISGVVNTLGGWIQAAINETENGTNPAETNEASQALSLLGDGSATVSLAQLASRAEADSKQLKQQIREDHMVKREKLFESTSSKQLFHTLLGGKTMNKGNFLDGLTPTEWTTLHVGVPAVPATLEFAKFLSWNCTNDAAIYLHNVFEYTSTSSNQLDAFANDIQNFVVKVQSFLTTIETYSGESGIKYLESEFMGFVDGAESALISAIEPMIDNIITEVVDSVEKAGEGVDPQKIIQEVEQVFESIIGGGTKPKSTKAVAALQEYTVSAAGQSMALRTKDASMEIFEEISTLLADLMNLLPAAVSTIKDARSEVCTVAQTMTSIFDVFAVKGPEIFDEVASIYSTLWIVYFCLLIPLTLGTLIYGFWASGYMGGPAAADWPEETEEEAARPKTFTDKMGSCWNACCICCATCHDNTLCFWSCVIVLQIIVLVLFVVAIVLCVLAGVKAFINMACEEIYMLNEADMCYNVLTSVKGFITTFIVDPTIPLDVTCDEKKLLLCELISKKMATSTMLTVIFSFLSAMFQYQLIVESAVLHERAVMRRIYDERFPEAKEQ
jgi:hypothetical protein